MQNNKDTGNEEVCSAILFFIKVPSIISIISTPPT